MKKLIEDKKQNRNLFLKDNYKHSNYKMIKFLEKYI